VSQPISPNTSSALLITLPETLVLNALAITLEKESPLSTIPSFINFSVNQLLLVEEASPLHNISIVSEKASSSTLETIRACLSVMRSCVSLSALA